MARSTQIIITIPVLAVLLYWLLYAAQYTAVSMQCHKYGVHAVRVDPDFEGFCEYRLSTGRVIYRELSYYTYPETEE